MGCLELLLALCNGFCAKGADSVRIPHSEIGELVLQAKSEGIFAFSEYPGKSSGLWLFIGVLHLLPGTAPGKDPDLLCSSLVLKSPPDSSQSESIMVAQDNRKRNLRGFGFL